LGSRCELTAAPERLGNAVQVVDRRHAAATRDFDAGVARTELFVRGWLREITTK
jgi:hypothetical protein